MRTTTTRASILAVLALAGCPRSSTPTDRYDVRGLDAEAASEQMADAFCGFTAACGEVSIECLASTEGTLSCTATIERGDEAECREEVLEEGPSMLECAEMTTAEQEALSDCLNALDDAECPTQADADAMAEAVERGEELEGSDPLPAECMVLSGLFSGCEEPDPPDPEPDSAS